MKCFIVLVLCAVVAQANELKSPIQSAARTPGANQPAQENVEAPTSHKSATQKKLNRATVEIRDPKELKELDRYFRVRLEKIYNHYSKGPNYVNVTKIYGARRKVNGKRTFEENEEDYFSLDFKMAKTSCQKKTLGHCEHGRANKANKVRSIEF